MFDLIKTFIFGIFFEKKYRYIFLFVLITLVYRFILWILVLFTYEMSPVDFVKINNDGGLTFIYARKYKETIYPYNFQLPTKSGRKNKKYDVKDIKNTKHCERDFFVLYKKAVSDLLKSSEDGKYILKFEKKFLKNYGEISYYDSEKKERSVFKILREQGFIFDKNEDIDYCKELKIKFKNTK